MDYWTWWKFEESKRERERQISQKGKEWWEVWTWNGLLSSRTFTTETDPCLGLLPSNHNPLLSNYYLHFYNFIKKRKIICTVQYHLFIDFRKSKNQNWDEIIREFVIFSLLIICMKKSIIFYLFNDRYQKSSEIRFKQGDFFSSKHEIKLSPGVKKRLFLDNLPWCG